VFGACLPPRGPAPVYSPPPLGIWFEITSPLEQTIIGADRNGGVRLSYAWPWRRDDLMIGLCLGRERATIITRSCVWKPVAHAAGSVDLELRMPRGDRNAPLFDESRFITAFLGPSASLGTV